jgi:phosphohistidine phosphatase
MRRIVLIRHAKPEPAGGSDRTRGLTAEGRDEAAALGRWLAAAGISPGFALVSAAVRTRQTWDEIAAALGHTAVSPRDDLYQSQPGRVIEMIEDVDDEVAVLAVVGHNPVIHEVALALAAEGPQRAELANGFPTAAAAVIDFAVEHWAQVFPGGGTLVGFVCPRSIRAATP